MSDLIERAYALAERAHAGQVRRVSGKPYITHPRRVADILLNAHVDRETIAAGYLHDVLEDADREMCKEFLGFDLSVVNVVWLVTHHGHGDGAKYRTLAGFVDYYGADERADSLVRDRAVCVFLADKIANVEDAWWALVHHNLNYERVKKKGLNVTRTLTWAGACYSALRSVEKQLPAPAIALLDQLRDRLNEFRISFL